MIRGTDYSIQGERVCVGAFYSTVMNMRRLLPVVAPAATFRRVCSSTAPAPPPRKKPFPTFAGIVYVGTIAAVLGHWLDERLDLRKWKTISYSVRSAASASSELSLSLRARTRPPPIGAMEWPGGRFLLQWALDECGLGAAASGTVLTIGEGIGVTAIGLALARQQEHGSTAAEASSSAPPPTGRVVASDFCDETLTLLRANVAAHGLTDDQLVVCKWDAAAGPLALAALPVPVEQIDHVIGADVVYHGFGEETDPSGRGLEKTLAARAIGP